MPIFYVALFAVSSLFFATPPKPKLPPTADHAMGVIVGVLREAESCSRTRELQDALQPLLYILGDLNGADADRVLAKLQWYRLGEANAGVYECIVSQRAMRSVRFQDQLAHVANDCVVQLGQTTGLCLSSTERSARYERVSAAISRRQTCEN